MPGSADLAGRVASPTHTRKRPAGVRSPGGAFPGTLQRGLGSGVARGRSHELGLHAPYALRAERVGSLGWWSGSDDDRARRESAPRRNGDAPRGATRHPERRTRSLASAVFRCHGLIQVTPLGQSGASRPPPRHGTLSRPVEMPIASSPRARIPRSSRVDAHSIFVHSARPRSGPAGRRQVRMIDMDEPHLRLVEDDPPPETPAAGCSSTPQHGARRPRPPTPTGHAARRQCSRRSTPACRSPRPHG